MYISETQAVDIVCRICDGHKPTSRERRILKEIRNLRVNAALIRPFERLRGLTNLKKLELLNTSKASLKGLSVLTNLESLTLYGEQIDSLEGVDELKKLKSLDVSKTSVRSLEELSGLTNLQSLDLRKTPVSSLEGISGLINLKKLYLTSTPVSSLEELIGLTNLQSLDLRETPVNSLEGISGLTNLKFLDLSYSQVSSMEGISGLTNLQALNLGGTQVSSMEEISELTNLQVLWLVGSRVSSLEKIATLPSLSTLSISGTSLDRIPKQFVDKGFRFITDEEFGWDPWTVYMKDVQLSDQPVSLFTQPRKFIEAWYQEQEQDAQQFPINEAKVIFLGDGGVGKTYTIYRIEHNGEEPNPEEIKTTPGVSITKYERGDKATIHFWDFGGQEIMHSMHRCFLTERTCYVVTVSNRWSEVTRQARRWLKNIESFAPNSKVILAVNQWEGVPDRDLDDRRLLQEFPNLVKVEKYAATKPKEIERLLELIENQVDRLPSVTEKFPRSWLEIMGTVRNRLDQKKEAKNYLIKKQDFHQICQDIGYKQEDYYAVLLTWFNDLGVCFSYHQNQEEQELADYVILNPEWLTNAVYIIVNNGEDFAENGRINRKGLLKILNNPTKSVLKGLEYDDKKLTFILDVTRQFQLSFNVEESQEFIPALCPNKTPDKPYPDGFVRRVRCEVKYDGYLPETVAHRLMVDCYRENLPLDRPNCWFKGLCVDACKLSGLYAVCDMGKDDDVLYVDVYQYENVEYSKPQSPQSLMRMLLNMIEKINGELGLKSTTWVCSNDERRASFQLETLFQALEMGRDIITVSEGGYAEYNICDLLGQIIDEPLANEATTSSEENVKSLRQELEFMKKEIQKMKEPSKVYSLFSWIVSKNNCDNVIGSRNKTVTGSHNKTETDSRNKTETDSYNKTVNNGDLNQGSAKTIWDCVLEIWDILKKRWN